MFVSSGLAHTALVAGTMALEGHLKLEAAFVCEAPAPPILTPIPLSRSPFCHIPIILFPLHIQPQRRCFSQDILGEGGIDGLSLWSSQSF